MLYLVRAEERAIALTTAPGASIAASIDTHPGDGDRRLTARRGPSLPFAYQSSTSREDGAPRHATSNLLLAGQRASTWPAGRLRPELSWRASSWRSRRRARKPRGFDDEEGVRVLLRVPIVPCSFLAQPASLRELGEGSPSRSSTSPNLLAARWLAAVAIPTRRASRKSLLSGRAPFQPTHHRLQLNARRPLHTDSEERLRRVLLRARQRAGDSAYHDGVYRARWLAGKNIGDEETLAALAERCGLDRAAFIAALTRPARYLARARREQPRRLQSRRGLRLSILHLWRGRSSPGGQRSHRVVGTVDKEGDERSLIHRLASCLSGRRTTDCFRMRKPPLLQRRRDLRGGAVAT